MNRKKLFYLDNLERNIDVNQCNPLISDILFKNVQDLGTQTLLTQVLGGRTFPKSLLDPFSWRITAANSIPDPPAQPPLSADYKNVVHHPNPTFAVGSPKGWVQIGKGWDWGEPTSWLGGGFRYLLFSPLFGGRFPFWLIFLNWVETTNELTFNACLFCCANKIHKVGACIVW